MVDKTYIIEEDSMPLGDDHRETLVYPHMDALAEEFISSEEPVPGEIPLAPIATWNVQINSIYLPALILFVSNVVFIPPLSK